MVVGFNHNFTYQGVVYHIQTEDGGLGRPNIVTLLYHGGTILASRKTSYADITRVEQLGKVVEDLMKEQHKGMLRSLKAGDFDEIIARFKIGQDQGSGTGKPEPSSAAGAKPTVAAQPGPPSAQPSATDQPEADQAAAPPAGKTPARPEKPTVEASLDEIILSYLMGDEK